MAKWLVVFDDGESWDNLDGCSLVYIPDDLYQLCLDCESKPKWWKDTITEELGEGQAKRMEEFDLKTLLSNGGTLADIEEEMSKRQPEVTA